MDTETPSQSASPKCIKTSAYNSQAQRLILNVLHFFKESASNPDFLKGGPRDLASRALKVSKRYLTNISRLSDTSVLRTPRKKLIYKKSKRDNFDSFDIQAIKNIVKQFYSEK